jgi:hypothetical protein
MTDERTVLAQLEQWFEEHQEQLSARGLSASLARSPDDGRNKPSLCLNIDSDARLGQLLLWDGGEAEVQIADVASGEVVQQHHDVTSRAELEAVLGSLLNQPW